MPTRLPRLIGLAGLSLIVTACSVASDSFGGGPSAPMQRSAPAVAVDSAALAERIGRITGEADRCGLTIDLERNKKMLRDFEKKVGRSDDQIAGTMAGFEASLARALASGCPAGGRTRVADELILIEDGQMNALMAR